MDTVRILEVGGEADAVEKDGITALHIAICYSCEEVVKVLLEFGANPTIIPADGETPESLTQNARGLLAELLNHPHPLGGSQSQ